MCIFSFVLLRLIFKYFPISILKWIPINKNLFLDTKNSSSRVWDPSDSHQIANKASNNLKVLRKKPVSEIKAKKSAMKAAIKDEIYKNRFYS